MGSLLRHLGVIPGKVRLTCRASDLPLVVAELNGLCPRGHRWEAEVGQGRLVLWSSRGVRREVVELALVREE